MLTIRQNKPVGKGFFKISKPTERDLAHRLHLYFPLLFSADERLETEYVAGGKEISAAVFPTGKETNSGSSLQVMNGLSRKLLFHLSSDRNFQIFWLNVILAYDCCPRSSSSSQT